jgi:hypothetical protein
VFQLFNLLADLPPENFHHSKYDVKARLRSDTRLDKFLKIEFLVVGGEKDPSRHFPINSL